MECVICGKAFSAERAKIGYNYCTSKDCVTKALSERRANYRLVLMPKQGFTYVSSNSNDLKNNGKSSGR